MIGLIGTAYFFGVVFSYSFCSLFYFTWLVSILTGVLFWDSRFFLRIMGNGFSKVICENEPVVLNLL